MIKFDDETFRVIGLFEGITHAQLKDCIVETGLVTFVVDPGQAGKAIGKSGQNVRILESQLKRKIKIVEFDPSVEVFIQHAVAPLKVSKVLHEDGIIRMVPADSPTRGMLIGRNASNLRTLEEFVKRYFPIKEIKVENV